MNRSLDEMLDLLAGGDHSGLIASAHADVPADGRVAHGLAAAATVGELRDARRLANLGADLDVYTSADRPGVLVLHVDRDRCVATRGDITFDAEWGAILSVANRRAALAVVTDDGLRLVVATDKDVDAYPWAEDEPSALDALDRWHPPVPPSDPGLPEPHTLLTDTPMPAWMADAVARLWSGDAVDRAAAIGTVSRLEPSRPAAQAQARLLAGDFGATERVRALARALPDAWVAACVDLAISHAAVLADTIQELSSVAPEHAPGVAATVVRAREDLACAWTTLFATGRAAEFGRALDDLDAFARQNASAFPPLPLLATDDRLLAARRAAVVGWWTEWLT